MNHLRKIWATILGMGIAIKGWYCSNCGAWFLGSRCPDCKK